MKRMLKLKINQSSQYFNRCFILAKRRAQRVTNRVGGAQRRVSRRCRAEGARSAGGCESRSEFLYISVYIYIKVDVCTALDPDNWLIGQVTRQRRARVPRRFPLFSASLRFNDQLETSNMKPFAISESHLTQYLKFQ